MQRSPLVALFASVLCLIVGVKSTALPFADCAGTEIMTTETVIVNQHIINVTVPACPGFKPQEQPVDIRDSLLARHSTRYFEKRGFSADNLRDRAAEKVTASPSECTNPSICQCGQSCSVQCQTFNSDPAATVADCQNLATILRSFHDTVGATFIQGKGFPNPIIVDFSTCRGAFGNTRTDGGLVEYCWDGLGDNVVTVTNGCLAPGITTGGLCTPPNTLWQMSVSGLLRA